MVFAAVQDNGTIGIYLGPDPVADRVIAIGDLLFGSTVTSFSFGWQGLNDLGQFTFQAGLQGGRTAIVRADPTAVPFGFSPGLGLFILGACGAVAQLRSKMKSKPLSLKSSVVG